MRHYEQRGLIPPPIAMGQNGKHNSSHSVDSKQLKGSAKICICKYQNKQYNMQNEMSDVVSNWYNNNFVNFLNIKHWTVTNIKKKKFISDRCDKGIYR